jgi:hypothetical protein
MCAVAKWFCSRTSAATERYCLFLDLDFIACGIKEFNRSSNKIGTIFRCANSNISHLLLLLSLRPFFYMFKHRSEATQDACVPMVCFSIKSVRHALGDVRFFSLSTLVSCCVETRDFKRPFSSRDRVLLGSRAVKHASPLRVKNFMMRFMIRLSNACSSVAVGACTLWKTGKALGGAIDPIEHEAMQRPAVGGHVEEASLTSGAYKTDLLTARVGPV